MQTRLRLEGVNPNRNQIGLWIQLELQGLESEQQLPVLWKRMKNKDLQKMQLTAVLLTQEVLRLICMSKIHLLKVLAMQEKKCSLILEDLHLTTNILHILGLIQ